MFNQLDTLSCNELVIFQNNNKRYEALGNVIFNRKTPLLNQKNYYTLQIQSKLKPMKMFIYKMKIMKFMDNF